MKIYSTFSLNSSWFYSMLHIFKNVSDVYFLIWKRKKFPLPLFLKHRQLSLFVAPEKLVVLPVAFNQDTPTGLKLGPGVITCNSTSAQYSLGINLLLSLTFSFINEEWKGPTIWFEDKIHIKYFYKMKTIKIYIVIIICPLNKCKKQNKTKQNSKHTMKLDRHA